MIVMLLNVNNCDNWDKNNFGNILDFSNTIHSKFLFYFIWIKIAKSLISHKMKSFNFFFQSCSNLHFVFLLLRCTNKCNSLLSRLQSPHWSQQENLRFQPDHPEGLRPTYIILIKIKFVAHSGFISNGTWSNRNQ